jgi:hypothetical protein
MRVFVALEGDAADAILPHQAVVFRLFHARHLENVLCHTIRVSTCD